MRPRALAEGEFARQTEGLVSHPAFVALEAGSAPHAAHDAFIENVARAHLQSPQVLGFLFALAPPAVAADLRHNLVEELGLDDGVAHPDLLRRLLAAAGLGAALPRVERAAQDDLRRLATDPILYGTLGELGQAVFLEVASFEWMLSRTAGRIGDFLARHRGLSSADLAWFSHHAEVDLRHAEEQLDAVERYADYYGIDGEHFADILGVTFRENVFVKRYFRQGDA